MSSDAAVLAVEGHIGEVLGLVEGGEHQAHVGQVGGPLEVVGLHISRFHYSVTESMLWPVC